MPRRQRKPRVEVTLPKHEDARLERLAIELNLSKSEVLLLGLSEEGRHQLDQAKERIKARDPDMKSKALAASDWRARGRRSERHLEQKPNEAQREQARREAQAKTLLAAGRRFYDVEAATGLSRLEVTALERERRAENKAGTRAALDDMAHRVSLVEAPEEEEEDEPQRYSSLRELNTDALSRLFY
jgi:hypothetical protein